MVSPEPTIDGKDIHSSYRGSTVKPIAPMTVAQIARDPETPGLPTSGIGGIPTWRDAAEFLTLGTGTVRICTAAMIYGFEVVGRAVPNVTDWQFLNVKYVTTARIDQEAFIKCGCRVAACEDTTRQAISMSEDCVFQVIDAECVARSLCVNVFPLKGCITTEERVDGNADSRTGLRVSSTYADYTTHPDNPAAVKATE